VQFVVLLMYVVDDVFGSHAGWRIGALAAAGPLSLRRCIYDPSPNIDHCGVLLGCRCSLLSDSL
jgi:hypothetical protein